MTTGMIQITLPRNRKVLDSDMENSIFTLLRRKEAIVGDRYSTGFHFGEFAMVQKNGGRIERAEAVHTAEMYTVDRLALTEVFSFVSPRQRRRFLSELFTSVRGTVHTYFEDKEYNTYTTSNNEILTATSASANSNLNANANANANANEDPSLHRFAARILGDIIEENNFYDDDGGIFSLILLLLSHGIE